MNRHSPEQPIEIEPQAESVDFDKCQIERVLEAYQQGKQVEWESFSPYLADHNMTTGQLLTGDKLTNTDAIGIAIAQKMRKTFPDARMISLYDEYNSDMSDSTDERGRPTPDGEQIEFPDEVKKAFRDNIQHFLQEQGILQDSDKEGENFLLVSESSKIEQAQTLVDELEAIGQIKHEPNGAIYFDNGQESFPLKTKSGRWLCEALDASAFLDAQNRKITHLVILPKTFQEQQDRVWAMLKELGHQPNNYHNIFFDPAADPDHIATQIQEYISQAQ